MKPKSIIYEENIRKANENLKGLILDINECFVDAKVV